MSLQTTLTWVRLEDGMPKAFQDVAMVLPDGRWGKGYWLSEDRGWNFQGCSGGSPAMIKRREPLAWAYFPMPDLKYDDTETTESEPTAPSGAVAGKSAQADEQQPDGQQRAGE